MEGSKSIYGLKSEVVKSKLKSVTLDSFVLSLLPNPHHYSADVKHEKAEFRDIRSYLFVCVLDCLKNIAGFCIPVSS